MRARPSRPTRFAGSKRNACVRSKATTSACRKRTRRRVGPRYPQNKRRSVAPWSSTISRSSRSRSRTNISPRRRGPTSLAGKPSATWGVFRSAARSSGRAAIFSGRLPERMEPLNFLALAQKRPGLPVGREERLLYIPPEPREERLLCRSAVGSVVTRQRGLLSVQAPVQKRLCSVAWVHSPGRTRFLRRRLLRRLRIRTRRSGAPLRTRRATFSGGNHGGRGYFQEADGRVWCRPWRSRFRGRVPEGETAGC